MSDLHCPATLLVARHGDAQDDRPSVLSDDGGRLSPLGRHQVRELAAELAPRNIARVWSSRLARAAESATIAAQALGVDAVEVDGLQELSVGTLAGRDPDDPELASVFRAWADGDLERCIPGGESGEGVVRRYREGLLTIADQHRGETVLVFSHGGVMSFVLPRLAATVRRDLAEQRFLTPCAVSEVAVDGDGFRVLTWPGTPPPPDAP
ncbi:MAG: histidine phosphatase family protein [Pedococcus sp.]